MCFCDWNYTLSVWFCLRANERIWRKFGRCVYILQQSAVPLQAWTSPEGSRKLRFPDFVKTAQDGGKIFSLTQRPPLPPRKYSWYSFLLDAESTPKPQRNRRDFMTDTSWDLTNDLPVCSTLITVLTRSPCISYVCLICIVIFRDALVLNHIRPAWLLFT